jgi:uncharacterized membrane protein YgcG
MIADREKVVKGLEAMREFFGFGLPSQSTVFEAYQNILTNALAILKEQRHGETFTVIDTKTGEEADEYEIALHEDWAKHLCYCDMEGWAIENDGTLLLVDECGKFAYADRERFKVVWDA